MGDVFCKLREVDHHHGFAVGISEHGLLPLKNFLFWLYCTITIMALLMLKLIFTSKHHQQTHTRADFIQKMLRIF